MSCLLTAGYTLGCRDNLGGIQTFYVGNFSAATTFTTGVDNIITGGTIVPTFYTIEQRNEVGDYREEGAHSVENGTNFWTQTAMMTLYKNQASIRDLLLVLAQTRLQVLVKDQNGKIFMIGEQNGADLTASSIGAGKAYGDLNGATFTLTAKEPYPAREVSSTYFGTLTIV